MTRYYCSPSSGIRTTEILGQAMDRAVRPMTAGELAEITGVDVQTVRAFLRRNVDRRVISVRVVPRRLPSYSGKRQGEYWRGRQDIHGTFGMGEMITRRQTQELAEGVRPMQWRGDQGTVWSVDESNTVAVRRGNTVLTLGKAERITATKRGASIRMADGSRMEFSAHDNSKRQENGTD